MFFTILWWPFLIVLTYNVIVYLLEQFKVVDLTKKAVLITGCDSGFGRELVFKCLENGLTVFAGCLTENVRSHVFFFWIKSFVGKVESAARS